MLNAGRPEHARIKQRIIQHNLEKKPQIYKIKIEEAGFDTLEPTVEALILRMTDNHRLERGRSIKDEDLVIEESSDEVIKAKIRKYMIEVDLKGENVEIQLRRLAKRARNKTSMQTSRETLSVNATGRSKKCVEKPAEKQGQLSFSNA
jgi:hypothetical protein